MTAKFNPTMNVKSIPLLLVVLSLNIFLYSQPFGEAAENFRITKLEYENSIGEKGCTYFKYDNNGILIKAFWVLDDKSRSSKNLYEYDSKGWLSGTMKYQYNEQKKKKSAVLVKGGKTICQVSYEYDDNYNLTEESWDFQEQWNQAFNYYYEKKDINKNYYSNPLLANESKYRISKENYTFNNEIGGPSLYYYNEEGLLYKKVFIRSDSITTTTFYEYDPERKLITSKRNYSDGSVAVFNYVYDENSNLVFRSYNREDTLAGFESYFYNSEGDLIKAYIKNFDNWLTGITYYNLDETGRITGGEMASMLIFPLIIIMKV
jgi:hypothetical protein